MRQGLFGRATIVACVAILVALQAVFAGAAQQSGHRVRLDQIAVTGDEMPGVAPICDSTGTPSHNDRCDHTGCYICSNGDDRELAVFLVAATLSILQLSSGKIGVAPALSVGLPPAGVPFKGPGAPRAPPHFS